MLSILCFFTATRSARLFGGHILDERAQKGGEGHVWEKVAITVLYSGPISIILHGIPNFSFSNAKLKGLRLVRPPPLKPVREPPTPLPEAVERLPHRCGRAEMSREGRDRDSRCALR